MSKRPDYHLTPSVRRRLKKPLGRLLLPPQLKSGGHLLELAEAKLVITVGDRVTETLHELGRTPDVQVVDGMEMRVKRVAPAVPYSKMIRVRNPAGVITRGAIKAINSSFKSRRRPVRLLVRGEEDLLAIPAVISAPLGSIVYYGQPRVGVVSVRVDGATKMRARETLRKMAGRN